MLRVFTNNDRFKATSMMFLMAGAVAGPAHSIYTYPVDSIKSNIQAGRSLLSSIRKTFRS